MSYFQHFIRIMQEEEEKKDIINNNKRMSSFIWQSMNDEKFWFHELIYSYFKRRQNAA